jgi:hypothetical protein
VVRFALDVSGIETSDAREFELSQQIS